MAQHNKHLYPSSHISQMPFPLAAVSYPLAHSSKRFESILSIFCLLLHLFCGHIASSPLPQVASSKVKSKCKCPQEADKQHKQRQRHKGLVGTMKPQTTCAPQSPCYPVRMRTKYSLSFQLSRDPGNRAFSTSWQLTDILKNSLWAKQNVFASQMKTTGIVTPSLYLS